MGDMIAASMVEMVTSLKVIYDLRKTVIEARDAGIAREKMIELQREIFATQENALSAQSDQFELLKRVDALEAELAYLKEWDAKREKYRLTKLSNFTDALGYTLEEKVDSSGRIYARAQIALRIALNRFFKKRRERQLVK